MDKKQLISIENLEKWLYEIADNNDGVAVEDMAAACENIIDRLPGLCTYAKEVSDVVEVVRCKDCKHCDPENGHCDHSLSTSLPFSRKPDDYCSYGERRKKYADKERYRRVIFPHWKT